MGITKQLGFYSTHCHGSQNSITKIKFFQVGVVVWVVAPASDTERLEQFVRFKVAEMESFK